MTDGLSNNILFDTDGTPVHVLTDPEPTLSDFGQGFWRLDCSLLLTDAMCKTIAARLTGDPD